MPSDCQCSSACACDTIVKVKVIDDRKATELISKLEKELKELKEENSDLKLQVGRAKTSKNKLKEQLKKQIDSM